MPGFMRCLLLSLILFLSPLRAETLDADLLIVGGNESACAAAVQGHAWG